MKKLIVLVGLLLSLQALAEVPENGPSWRDKARTFVSQLIGEEWGERLFGKAPQASKEVVTLPEIPSQIKKSTDVTNYTKKIKDQTEFDRLSSEQKRHFDFNFLEELFLVTRQTEAKDEDLSSWLNTLDQGGSREGIYQALVLDEVYAALENIEEKPSQKLLDFSLDFSQRFLNQSLKKDSLEKLNLYSIKRILTEKALDLMEYYEVNNLDSLNQWYAVFSADLAKKYGHLLKNKIRQDPNPLFHLEWAKGVPVQHIKSEFIIKFHLVTNGLQLAE